MNYKIRNAKKSDIKSLVIIENSLFESDKLSKRNFQWLLSRGNTIFNVMVINKAIIGYGIVTLNKGTSLARLYSLAISNEQQGKGYSKILLDFLEDQAVERGYASMRLEVRKNNLTAINLYKKRGYRFFRSKEDYYEDGGTALCFEKTIAKKTLNAKKTIPYYSQGTDFTCGPASLMIALKYFQPKLKLDFHLELEIWREATTIFMASGHGGCGPRGLALSAKKRNLRPIIYINKKGSLFSESVRSDSKKNIIKEVNKYFIDKCQEQKIPTHYKELKISEIKDYIKSNHLIIALLSTYHFNQKKVPHWIIIVAIDEKFIYIHDPDMIPDKGDLIQILPEDRMYIPLTHQQFKKSFSWGKDKLKTAVVLKK